jgi:hypothetical protein
MEYYVIIKNEDTGQAPVHMPIILLTQEAEIKRISGSSKPAPGKQFEKLYLKNTPHKKGLAEWLK